MRCTLDSDYLDLYLMFNVTDQYDTSLTKTWSRILTGVVCPYHNQVRAWVAWPACLPPLYTVSTQLVLFTPGCSSDKLVHEDVNREFRLLLTTEPYLPRTCMIPAPPCTTHPPTTLYPCPHCVPCMPTLTCSLH